jgi:hypothetical protein
LSPEVEALCRQKCAAEFAVWEAAGRGADPGDNPI